MKELEYLQAQIDALRLLLISVVAQSPTDSLIREAKKRFETWENMHPLPEISESYQELMRAEKDRALQSLQAMREQYSERTPGDPNPHAEMNQKTPS